MSIIELSIKHPLNTVKIKREWMLVVEEYSNGCCPICWMDDLIKVDTIWDLKI